jgi:hypothetical protein
VSVERTRVSGYFFFQVSQRTLLVGSCLRAVPARGPETAVSIN